MDVPRNRRQRLRLRNYDYGQPGFYFVTLCIHNRECLLGEVVDGSVQLTKAGLCVEDAWYDLPRHYANVSLDAFVVMPNHVHGIIHLIDAEAGLNQLLPKLHMAYRRLCVH
jgi:REP-associated tyrosine transposase